ncbi:GNAT family N-acetyltransferase [Desulfopila aestuarii]|uniref:Acetyltransferase (GNAT) family protein n=1 Tax=Desulfopila aestuarii DSM 18488 TaxID=1121416 RepID=A0A1M7Y3M0_9BACT|nr:GNAT family N-acetyltransferase [Desulfopila aestuarii]SHO46816.1 Acetyltransferase (GNAT) family protein [Desulfopila aestuarii DSM 18488]
MKIEQATLQNLSEVHEYMSGIFELKLNGLSIRPNGFTKEETKQYLPEASGSKEKLCAIVRYNDKIVGQLSFSRYSKPEYVHGGKFGMSVSPDHWRNGIGSRLLEYLESWAIENEVEKLELEVWSNNENAICLYKKKGYEVEGSRKNAIKANGQVLDVILMGKILANKTSHRTHAGGEMLLCEANNIEEPCAGKPHAGIVPGATG